MVFMMPFTTSGAGGKAFKKVLNKFKKHEKSCRFIQFETNFQSH